MIADTKGMPISLTFNEVVCERGGKGGGEGNIFLLSEMTTNLRAGEFEADQRASHVLS